MSNRRIVIINDDKDALGDLEEILLVIGYESVVVTDAFLAKDIIAQSKPDVILLELKMPRRNGFEIADEINRVFESKRIPIIVMSESFKDDFRFLTNLCGIKLYLKRPFNPLDVILAIESVTANNNQWEEKNNQLDKEMSLEMAE